MDTVAAGKNAPARRIAAKRTKKNQTNSGKDAVSKGTMREPTQKPSAENEQEELKVTLQELEETKGDWSKGG